MALTRLPSFTVDSTSSFTFANVTVTSNVAASNANLGNAVTANYFVGNGSLLTGVNAASLNGFTSSSFATAAQGSKADTALQASNLVGYATTSYVGNAVANLVASAPAALDTLNELANALGNDASYSTTITNALANKLSTTSFSSTANTWISTQSTSNLVEGTNLYYTVSRANSAIDARVTKSFVDTLGVVANISNVAYSVAGANVTGQVANALVAGTVYTNAQPNITSVGTLTSLSVTGNITSGNATLGNATTSNYFIGNGSLLTGIARASAADSVANGTSNVNIPAINGNVTFGVSGNSNVVVVTGTGINVAGYVTTNNFVATSTANLGSVSNVKITGGSSNQLLQTDGTGNISWVTPTGTTITVDNFTANGVQTAFTLSTTPATKAYTMVSLAGTLQPRSIYSVTGNVITFSSAPPNTAPIEVTTFSSILGYGGGDITANTITANTLTGNVIAANSNLTVNTLTANSVVNGGSGTPTLQSNTSIVLSAATVVRVSTSPMQFYTCTTTVRDTIAASNGYVIYNTTTNKLQVYANGAWADLN